MKVLLVVGDSDVLYLFDPHPESFEIELETNGNAALKRYRAACPSAWVRVDTTYGFISFLWNERNRPQAGQVRMNMSGPATRFIWSMKFRFAAALIRCKVPQVSQQIPTAIGMATTTNPLLVRRPPARHGRVPGKVH